MSRLPLWCLLLVLSILIHLLASVPVTRDMRAQQEFLTQQRKAVAEKREVIIEVQKPEVQPPLLETPPPEETLDFEKEFEIEPPEILVAAEAVTPPPVNVPVTLRADSGGTAGSRVDSVATGNPNTAQTSGNLPAIAGVTGTLAAKSGGSGTQLHGVGVGNGLGNSANQFAAYIAGLRDGGLDVIFVVDATGSMGWVIDEVKTRIGDIVETVRSLVPIARFGIVAYRDKEDPEFVTRVQPLTFSIAKLKQFLSTLKAQGGGDIYEAIDQGLETAIQASDWRAGARRIIIVIGDAPPQDGSLSGVVRQAEKFNASGGTVSTLDVGDQANPALVEAKVGRKVNRALYSGEAMYQFRLIADGGGGDSATLDGDIAITRRLITLIMGDQFAHEMKALLELI